MNETENNSGELTDKYPNFFLSHMGTYSGGSRWGDASPIGIQQFFAREKYRKLLQPEAIFWLKCMKERLAIGFLRGPRRGAYSAPSNLLADLAGFKGAASLQGRTRKGRHGSNKRERKMDHPLPTVPGCATGYVRTPRILYVYATGRPPVLRPALPRQRHTATTNN